jgi:hypothetical protein
MKTYIPANHPQRETLCRALIQGHRYVVTVRNTYVMFSTIEEAAKVARRVGSRLMIIGAQLSDGSTPATITDGKRVVSLFLEDGQ